jgi:hypothetical protein
MGRMEPNRVHTSIGNLANKKGRLALLSKSCQSPYVRIRNPLLYPPELRGHAPIGWMGYSVTFGAFRVNLFCRGEIALFAGRCLQLAVCLAPAVRSSLW